MPKPKYRHFSIMASEGGKLIAGSISGDTAGAANYVEKVNFRRETDGEVRREGWEKLKIDETLLHEIDVNFPVRLLYQFQSEGENVIIAGAGDKIYVLNPANKQWNVIASGLQHLDLQNPVVKPIRWEAVSIDGFCIINNGADLPLIYRNGWSCAYPVWGLRERGIIRVGTIAEFDGRLWCADITYLDEDSNADALSNFMSAATEPYGLPENESFSVATLRSPHSIEYSAWRLAYDVSIAKGSPYLFGQVYSGEVSSMSGSTLAEIKLPFIVGGVDPNNTLNPYHNSTVTNFSTFRANDTIRISVDTTPGLTPTYVVYDAVIASIFLQNGETKITLTAPRHNLEALTAFGDPNSASSTTPQVGEPVQFILLKEPDAFSNDANIQKESADGMSFPEDGSTILKMVKLSDKLLVYRQSGYLAISRGNTQSAYFFEEKYRGERVADLRNTIISITEQRHMFVGYNGVYVVSPSNVEPAPFPTFMNGTEFWRNISTEEIEYCYSAENSLTQEVFLVCPISVVSSDSSGSKLDWGVIAYDTLQDTLSFIDVAFTACASIQPLQGIQSRTFLLAMFYGDDTYSYVDQEVRNQYDLDAEVALGSKLMKYGYGSAETTDQGKALPYRLFLRDNADYVSKIKYGKTDFNDKFSEKKLRSYVLHLADIFSGESYATSDYVSKNYTEGTRALIEIATYSTSKNTSEEQISETLSALETENMIPVYVQANYLQDTISISGPNNGAKVLGRTFEVSGVRTRHTSEAHNINA